MKIPVMIRAMLRDRVRDSLSLWKVNMFTKPSSEPVRMVLSVTLREVRMPT